MILDSNNLGGRKMDLWIRSQDKTKLVKIDNISYLDMSDDYEKKVHSLFNDCKGILGVYKTKNRALEVLEEIQNILVGTIIIKSNVLLSPSDQEKLREKFKIDTLPIIEQPSYEIKPLQNFIVYKMPEE